jgi:hypothetical protein
MRFLVISPTLKSRFHACRKSILRERRKVPLFPRGAEGSFVIRAEI